MEFNKKLLLLEKEYKKYLEDSELKEGNILKFSDYCVMFSLDDETIIEEQLEDEVLNHG